MNTLLIRSEFTETNYFHYLELKFNILNINILIKLCKPLR